MFTPRTLPASARLILAFYLLVLAVANLSPIVNPVAMEMICAGGGGMKMVMISDDGELLAGQDGHSSLDCPLCTAFHPALPVAEAPLPRHEALAHALLPAVAAHLHTLVGAPLPARGPPATLHV
jgi:hypothetical protein